MDLLATLPSFSTKSYSHILPPLERSNINTVDLITLDTLEIAKRAHVPPADVRRLSAQIIDALHRDVGFESDIDGNTQCSSSFNADAPVAPGPSNRLPLSRWAAISTLDPAMDALLDGGIPTGYVTEIAGERLAFFFFFLALWDMMWLTMCSGSGKTQFLLSLLLAAQLPSPKGLGKRAIYISTETPLATPRLSQYLKFHPYLSSLPPDQTPSLQNVLAINAMDLETQDHIINYQLPVAIARYDVGLVVVDSITANFRAEHLSHDVNALSTRSGELAKLGQMLRNLAVQEDIAVVVANQVSDRFETIDNNPGVNHLSWIMPQPAAAVDSNSPVPKPRISGTETKTQPNLNYAVHTNINMINPPPSSSPAFPSSPSPFPAEEDPQFDGSYLVGNPVRSETLSLLHQQRFFTGWGDSPQPQLQPQSQPQSQSQSQSQPRTQGQRQWNSTRAQKKTPKTPALGFVWTTQIACRLALKKEEDDDDSFALDGESAGITNGPTVTAEPEQTKSASQIPDEPSPTEKQTQPKPKPSPPEPEPAITEKHLKRTMKLVFAPWTAGSALLAKQTDADADVAGNTSQTGTDNGGSRTVRDEVEFAITVGGLKAVER